MAARAWMDIKQGTKGLPLFSDDWLTQAGAMSLPTLYALGFSLAGGITLMKRHLAWTLVLYSGVIVFLFFTSLNNLDFLASQTLQRVDVQRAKATQARDIAAIQNEETLKERKEARETLWRTYTITKKEEDRAKILAQIRSITEAPVNLQQVAVEPVDEGGSRVLENWTGIKASTWAQAKTLIMPIAFMVFEIVALSIAIGAWPARKTVLERPPDGGGETFGKTPGMLAKLQVFPGGKVSPRRRYEPAEAKKDLGRMLGEAPTIDKASVLAERWNWSLPTVLRALERWENEGVCRTRKDGRERIVLRPGPKEVRGTA